jgi:pectate lyase
MKTIICAGVIWVAAVYAPAFAADGFATVNGDTTGGEGATTVTVSNLLDLIKYAGSNGPCNVQVIGSIFCPTKVTVKSDKTIVGLGTTAAINGNLYVSGVSNVIIRNLFISNPTDDNSNGTDDEDGITVVNGANHIWIDHCTFSDCLDGEADITKTSDWVTVSWCKFNYTQIVLDGDSKPHNFVNLVGADDNDTFDAGKLHVTFHHNWWSTLCMERMPRVRFGQVHVFNNYYGSPGNGYCIGVGCGSQILVENNYFDNVNNLWKNYSTGTLCTQQGLIHWNSNNAFTNGATLPTWASNSTVFAPSYDYTLDAASGVKASVTNHAGAGRMPVAGFSASPTAVSVPPLDVTFTDTSSGPMITDRFWDFGDGATTNTTETSLTHTYTNLGSYDVSLTVSSVVGSNTLTRPGYITIAKLPPVIDGELSVTNATLSVGNVAVVVAGEPNVFSVGATDPDGESLVYQWSFGDGDTAPWSPSNTVEHAYSNCGPFTVSATISNTETSVTSNFTVAVACELGISKSQLKLNFAKPNADGCKVTGTFDLPAEYSFSNRLATLNIGGAQVSFALDSKGAGVNGYNKFGRPKYNATTRLWTFKATLKNGSWQTPWADYSMINSNIPKPGVAVADLPVILLVDTEAFMATTNLQYTATQGKSGSAK